MGIEVSNLSGYKFVQMNTLFKTVTASNDSSRRYSDVVSFDYGVVSEQKIFIKNLSLNMFIGAFDSEKAQRQRVIVSAELTVTPNENWHADDMHDIISYANVVKRIEAIAEKEHIHLVETFAELIIQDCFRNKDVQSVTVRVEKPDILNNVETVGAEITRKR